MNFWRTKNGAEVDFILSYNNQILPIEIKYQHFKQATISKSFHSFIKAYEPNCGIIITNDFIGEKKVATCTIKFIPLSQLNKLFKLIRKLLLI